MSEYRLRMCLDLMSDDAGPDGRVDQQQVGVCLLDTLAAGVEGFAQPAPALVLLRCEQRVGVRRDVESEYDFGLFAHSITSEHNLTRSLIGIPGRDRVAGSDDRLVTVDFSRVVRVAHSGHHPTESTALGLGHGLLNHLR